MAATPSNQEAMAPMKSRVFTFTCLLALLVAMAASTSAFAQSSPGQSVYNPSGEVLDFVQGGGSDTGPSGGQNNASGGHSNGATAPVTQEKGTSPSAAPAVTSGQLPFTGFQAGLVALAGVALLGAGVAMRRVAKND